MLLFRLLWEKAALGRQQFLPLWASIRAGPRQCRLRFAPSILRLHLMMFSRLRLAIVLSRSWATGTSVPPKWTPFRSLRAGSQKLEMRLSPRHGAIIRACMWISLSRRISPRRFPENHYRYGSDWACAGAAANARAHPGLVPPAVEKPGGAP